MRAFTVFIGFVPHLPIPQVLALPVFSPHCALFLTQGKAVGYHGDEFAVCRLALDEAAASIRFCWFDTKKSVALSVASSTLCQ